MTIQTTKRDRLTFISAYGQKKRIKIFFTTKGRTKQNHKAECDINTIINNFKRTGALPDPSRREARYGDATGIDFQNAQLLVAQAKGMFAELPARIRDRFENDPGKFMSFMDNPRNRVEAEELGLLATPPTKPQEPPHQGQSMPPSTPPAETFNQRQAWVAREGKAAEAADKTNTST